MSTIDLSRFYATFFAESLSGLDEMEAYLLQLEADVEDSEALHAIFRAVHSIKGASGTFGFTDIGDFAHVLETFLAKVRDGELVPTPDIVDTTLQAVDCMRGMLAKTQAGEKPDPTRARELCERLRVLEGQTGAAPPASATASATDAADTARRSFDIYFHPKPYFFSTGNDPLRLFRVLESLGELTVEAETTHVPDWPSYDPESCYLAWHLRLTTERGRKAIDDVFDWVIEDCELVITEADEGRDEAPIAGDAGGAEQTARAQARAAAQGSLHVSTEKVDSLINTVGELVITHTMLKRWSERADLSQWPELQDVLEKLERDTRELQHSVMSIRMLPISFVFNRFARVVRDLSQELGKRVELKITGGQSELDKSVIEKLVDPLTHLVRNSLDHGIETPEARRQKGKPETATLRLHAEHKGGNIVIHVQDDGAGLNRDKIRAKAIERGLLTEGETLAPEEIDQLIFLPGFSTVDIATSVSGRGVGMDVVRRNILDLGGAVDVHSEEGRGVTFTIRLPLTLAILDGMSISVGEQMFILPLAFIVESLQAEAGAIKTIAGEGQVVDVRGEYLPLLSLAQLLSIPSSLSLHQGMLVLLESEGKKVALAVDSLVGQDQVVIKSLEANYRKVPYLSAATILGDGRVAFILDANALVRVMHK